jgi:hypothetical protein
VNDRISWVIGVSMMEVSREKHRKEKSETDEEGGGNCVKERENLREEKENGG